MGAALKLLPCPRGGTRRGEGRELPKVR